MPNLPNPWLLLATIAISVAAYVNGVNHGRSYAEAEFQIKVSAAQAKVSELNEQARMAEQKHSEQINSLATKLSKAQADAQSNYSILGADLRSGAIRLSVPIAGAGYGLQPGKGATPASGGGNQARAVLDAEAAEFLVGIAKEGDDAIRQLNACIDSYNQLRELP